MLSRYSLIALIALLAVCSAYSSDDAWEKHNRDCQYQHHQGYSYSVLTLTWPGDFCGRNSKCSSDWINSWDGYSFLYSGKSSLFMDTGLHTKENIET